MASSPGIPFLKRESWLCSSGPSSSTSLLNYLTDNLQYLLNCTSCKFILNHAQAGVCLSNAPMSLWRLFPSDSTTKYALFCLFDWNRWAIAIIFTKNALQTWKTTSSKAAWTCSLGVMFRLDSNVAGAQRA